MYFKNYRHFNCITWLPLGMFIIWVFSVFALRIIESDRERRQCELGVYIVWV